MDELLDMFRCVTIQIQDNYYIIECKLGNWCVGGANCATVTRRAIHYWRQYYADGEYDELLGSKGNE